MFVVVVAVVVAWEQQVACARAQKQTGRHAINISANCHDDGGTTRKLPAWQSQEQR
jgi:hypothetical protein